MLRQRLRESAQTRVRFAYRRVLVLLGREGWWDGHTACIASIRKHIRRETKAPVAARIGVASEAAPTVDGRAGIFGTVETLSLTTWRHFRALSVTALLTRERLTTYFRPGPCGGAVVAKLKRLIHAPPHSPNQFQIRSCVRAARGVRAS